MKSINALAIVALLCSPLLATAHEHATGNLHINQPWSREMPPSAPTAAVYLVVQNDANSPDRLLGVETPAAAKAELHEHIHQNGLMKMQQVASVAIPANGSVAFAPMAYHVMLFGLKEPLKAGQTLSLTLHFEQAGAVQVEVPVLKDAPATQDAPAHNH